MVAQRNHIWHLSPPAFVQGTTWNNYESGMPCLHVPSTFRGPTVTLLQVSAVLVVYSLKCTTALFWWGALSVVPSLDPSNQQAAYFVLRP